VNCLLAAAAPPCIAYSIVAPFPFDSAAAAAAPHSAGYYIEKPALLLLYV
jgi:hypothetical protein